MATEMTTAIKRFNGIIQQLDIPGAQDGPLAGLTFLAKDLFDVKGEVTGIGNPTYAKSHSAAKANAVVIDKLLNAGASLVGKTCSDEFAFSVDGINIHFGTPNNPQYPDRIPGGSSSGSGSAVAAGLADFALGTDTGGSIRVPASYCGCFGFRPSHGRVSVEGVAPLAPLMDAVGWMTKDAMLLETCGVVLLDEKPAQHLPKKLFIAKDMFSEVAKELRPSLERAVEKLAEEFIAVEDIELGRFGWGSLAALYKVFQAKQAWEIYGAWLRENNPPMCPSIKERFEFTSTVRGKDWEAAKQARDKVVSDMEQLISNDAVLCMPTTVNLPPLVDASDEVLLKNRIQNMNHTALSPLSRLPEVCVPIAVTEKTTTGLSLLASHGNDMMLLKVCREMLPTG